MNPWNRGATERNPYRRTAFRIARVRREAVRLREVATLIENTRRVAADPEKHQIDGTPVTETELNAAELVLTDPAARMAEELLEHAAEKPVMDEIEHLARQIEQGLSVPWPLPVTSCALLEEFVRAVMVELLRDGPSSDPSFGALELSIPPPFGPDESGE